MTKSPNRVGLIALAGALTSFGPFTVDPYLPSFPKIAQDLNSDLATVQLSVSAITLGFVLGTLLVGPLSDAYGRRKPLLYSAAGYLLATFLLIFANSIPLLFAAKVAQGAAASAAVVVSTALVRDLFSGLALVKAMGQWFLVGAAFWVIAPVSGSLLLNFTDWRGVAAIISIYSGALTLATFMFLKETHVVATKQKVDALAVLKKFGHVLKDRTFAGLVIVSISVGVAQFGYIVVYPAVLGNAYDIPPNQIGLYFAANSLFAYSGIQVSSWLGRKFATQWVIAFGITLGLLVGAGLIAAAYFESSFFVVIAATFLWLFFFGFLYSLVQALALAHHGEEAGTAAAILASASYVATTVAGPYFTTLNMANTSGFGGNILLFMFVAMAAYFLISRPWTMKRLH